MVKWGQILLLISYLNCAWAAGQCSGHFINPITDICWSCLFPMSLGSAQVKSGVNPDTSNPASPLQVCPVALGWRLGLAVGYWEPFATTEVTRTPYCLVNLGGLEVNISDNQQQGAVQSSASGTRGAFYQVHWYKYPLISWLNLLSSVACMQDGDYDIGYLSELDPTWDDDALGFLLWPEAELLATPSAQAACAADAVAANTGAAKNELFWCMGAQGSSYPLTGNVSAEYSSLQNATLLSERMDFKLHKEGLVEDSSSQDGAVCQQHYLPILPKNRYRYELMNPTAQAEACYPFGHSVTSWQAKVLDAKDKGNYGFLIWRKRNCVIL